MSNFLFHKVSEKEKQEIKIQAKNIMNNFSKKLSKIKISDLKEPTIERKDFQRKENSEIIDNSFDKNIMFENAPKKNPDFIITEKKSW